MDFIDKVREITERNKHYDERMAKITWEQYKKWIKEAAERGRSYIKIQTDQYNEKIIEIIINEGFKVEVEKYIGFVIKISW